MQLIQSMPYEIKEKIMGYHILLKTQPQLLLTEIKEFGKMKEFSQYISNFEIFVDRCNFSDDFIETTDNIYEYLWPGLDTIKNSQYKHLNHWKYAGELKRTEIAHANEEKCFDLLNWEKSFALYFWMCIYH